MTIEDEERWAAALRGAALRAVGMVLNCLPLDMDVDDAATDATHRLVKIAKLTALLP